MQMISEREAEINHSYQLIHLFTILYFNYLPHISSNGGLEDGIFNSESKIGRQQ